jgi:hypothetical protein
MLPMPATSKRTRLLEEVVGYHVQRKRARTLHIVSQLLDDLPSSDAPSQANCYVFILSWYRAPTCTNVSSLFVLPACLFALTGLTSDLAAISILSSYVPLCASSLTFPYLYRLSHAYVASLL